jgi:thiamine pyrophosphokinase
MKKVLILCNGNPPSEELFLKYRANAVYFIAADGGGNIARQFDVEPDVVIGDLDSFEESDNDSFDIIFEPDQYSNDLEKALELALEEQATHVHVLGATGYRLDHTLKNLSVLKQFHNQFRDIRFADNFGEIQLLESSFSQQIEVGTTLSLFPLSGTVSGISTEGLKYPLSNESLENGVRDGSSNEVVDNPVKITHEQGDLLLFIARQ